jgi:hypothetical protein
VLFETLLARCREAGLLRGGRQRTDSTTVFAAIRTLPLGAFRGVGAGIWYTRETGR